MIEWLFSLLLENLNSKNKGRKGEKEGKEKVLKGEFKKKIKPISP